MASHRFKENMQKYTTYVAVALFGYVIGGLHMSTRSTSISLFARQLEEVFDEYGPGNTESEEILDEEMEEEKWDVLSSTVVCIVLFLIFMTIAFEEMKEGLEHNSDHQMLPIIEKMFGEMTVLGFLSMFSFLFTKTGVFEIIGERIFGNGEELVEIFEFVHFVIFFIMVFFVLQIMLLLRCAAEIEAHWEDMDILLKSYSKSDGRLSKSISQPKFLRANSKEITRYNSTSNFLNLLPGLRDEELEENIDSKMYEALRVEFIQDRSTEPPFKPAMNKVEDDFNFGKYLGACLNNILEHAAHVSVYTWAFFAVATVIYYGYIRLVEGEMHILAWSWCIAGWLFYIFNIYFEQHLLNLRKHLVNCFVADEVSKEQPRMSVMIKNRKSSIVTGNSTENTPLIAIDPEDLEGNDDDDDDFIDEKLPMWAHVDMDEYMKARRPWLYRALVGGNPSRQQTFYWFEQSGPKFYMLLLQINLIYTGLYCAMLILSFIPYMHKEQPWYIFALYLVFAILPAFFLSMSKKHLFATLTQVRSVGIYRQPHIIANVRREQKTIEVVRTFLVIQKLRKFASVIETHERVKQSVHYSMLFDEHEIEAVGKTYDVFDKNGDGSIDYDEFHKLMLSIGAHMDRESLMRMVGSLDADGDGAVDKEEFLQWYADEMSLEDQKQSIEERAHDLFHMFDDDNSGSITLSEFKEKLDLFGRFTIDEVGELMNELDKDKSGHISAHELRELIVRFTPKEIKDLSSGNRRNFLGSIYKSR